MTLTFSAWGPFWPWVMSNSTFCPSSSLSQNARGGTALLVQHVPVLRMGPDSRLEEAATSWVVAAAFCLVSRLVGSGVGALRRGYRRYRDAGELRMFAWCVGLSLLRPALKTLSGAFGADSAGPPAAPQARPGQVTSAAAASLAADGPQQPGPVVNGQPATAEEAVAEEAARTREEVAQVEQEVAAAQQQVAEAEGASPR